MNKLSLKTAPGGIGHTLRESMAVSGKDMELDAHTGKTLILYTFFWTFMFFLAVPFACLVSGEGLAVFENFRLILISPSKLMTDYFHIGSPGATFLNAGLCGLSCNVAMLLSKAKPGATLLAGYFLVVAHCFYGLNFLNMWGPFLGVLVFSLVFKVRFGNILHIAMFATSLSPFISDFLFRYTLKDAFVFGQVQMTWTGALVALGFSLASGFIVPALLPGTTRMHRGYNLFKAGLAIGLFGMFAYAFMYITLGVDVPAAPVRDNVLYDTNGEEYIWFFDAFFVIIFLATFLFGFWTNGRSCKGYKTIWQCDGWHDDFPSSFGMPLTFINIGFYGLCVLAYFNLAFLITHGVGFTGPSVGVVIAAITFSASGQTPKNVWPIVFGYILLSGVTNAVGALAGIPIAWSISTQGHINGVAFATGLCPFTGRYGRKVGVIAGALHAILCTSTAAMHGGFVLYTGGLTSGLTAMLLLPILEFYGVKTKEDKLEQVR